MLSYTVNLEKVSANNNGLRTNIVSGITNALPCPGESFAMLGRAIDPKGIFRMVTTSPVTYVGFIAEPSEGRLKTCNFRTSLGTEYLLIILEQNEVEAYSIPPEDSMPLPEAQA